MPIFEVYKYGGSEGTDLFKQADIEAETCDGAFYRFSDLEPDTQYLLLDPVSRKYQKFETDANEVESRTFEPPAEPEPAEPEPAEPEPAEPEPAKDEKESE